MSAVPPTPRTLRLSVRAADARVELAARTTIRRCLAALGLGGVPVPVPVEQWIERPLGYRFGIADDAELAPGVLGVARPTTGEVIVAQSLTEHEGRYRFTCAHELGHLVLHQARAELFSDGELPGDPEAAAIEREADRFASALLLPLETLASTFEQARLASGLSEQCYPLLRGDDAVTVWLWRRCFVPFLVERYLVSRQAAIYRCREVRLPGQRRLVRPSLVELILAPKNVVAPLNLDQIRVVDGLPRSQ